MTSHDPAPSARLLAARSDASRLATLLGTEHSAMADFILALAAFDSSRGWAELGHASLFTFLERHLHLSKASAFHRSAAARLVQRFPSVAQALRAGRLCLSSTAELAKVLTPENEAEVVPRFFGLSSREAKELVAELAPHPSPPLREVVRAVSSSAGPVAAAKPELPLVPEPQPVAAIPSGAERVRAHEPVPAAPTPPADEAVPLTADLRRLHITVSRRFLQKLEAAREARSHARPNDTTEMLLEEALDLLLASKEKRRTAAISKPRRQTAPQEPEPSLPPAHRGGRDNVPAQARREVWTRDEGRCQWLLDGGGICGSTHRVQLDHSLPAARGGPPSVANLRILCEAHNKEAARRTFGRRWMERFGGTRPGRTG